MKSFIYSFCLGFTLVLIIALLGTVVVSFLRPVKGTVVYVEHAQPEVDGDGFVTSTKTLFVVVDKNKGHHFLGFVSNEKTDTQSLKVGDVVEVVQTIITLMRTRDKLIEIKGTILFEETIEWKKISSLKTVLE